MRKIIIGTRGSKLALAQASEVKCLLERAYSDIATEIRVIKTQGDKRLDLSLNASGDKGLFTKELEIALQRGEIDCAVHSLKDLPVEVSTGTIIAAILKRENPSDVFISRKYSSFADLPSGAIVGTSSPRRAAQLIELRSDIEVKEIRGNVDTRIAKLDAGEYDAIIMAYAGLKRLGLEHNITQVFKDIEMVPAPGQAAIAIQTLSNQNDLLDLFTALNDDVTARCVEIERYILSQKGGGCALPFACNCSVIEATDLSDNTRQRGFFVLVYDCEDTEQSLKAVVVSEDSTNEEIWKSLQEKSIPVNRE